MMAQTALVNEKQTASLLGGERVSSGIRLKLRIAAPNTAYTLNQFRVSASVDGGSVRHDRLVPAGAGRSHSQQDGIAGFRLHLYALISARIPAHGR